MSAVEFLLDRGGDKASLFLPFILHIANAFSHAPEGWESTIAYRQSIISHWHTLCAVVLHVCFRCRSDRQLERAAPIA